jgi:glycosyltransferase involved in cell wall biosynthesis
VEHIIAISQFTKSRIVDLLHVRPEKITVVLNGIDSRFTPSSEPDIELARASLGLGTAPYVLCTGAFVERKNTARLLRAWERICDRLPDDMKLVVAGGTGAGGVFSDFQIDRFPPKVIATGYVPDEHLPALYSGAVAFVYPSLYEGFGLPPLEAMACGTPVVTSGTTAIPEVVGDAAILVDPRSEEAIADGVLRVIESESLRRELRGRGLEKVQGLSWDRAANETWRVLQQAA